MKPAYYFRFTNNAGFETVLKPAWYKSQGAINKESSILTLPGVLCNDIKYLRME